MGYIRAFRLPKGSRTARAKQFRSYEVYWAPIAAGGVPYLEVLRWVVKQVSQPVTALRTPWRMRARLRRADLYRVRSKQVMAGLSDERRHDAKSLAGLYRAFESPEQQRDYPEGTFSQFTAYIRATVDDALTAARLVDLAKRWRTRYVWTELINQAVVTSMLVALALGILLLGLIGVALLTYLRNLAGLAGAASPFELNPQNVMAIGAGLIALLGVTKFFSDYLGDVLLWTTYEETNAKYQKRKAILKVGTETLAHVLADPLCARVVIVAHSLGSTIAHDTLLQLARFNRARGEPDRPRGAPPPGPAAGQSAGPVPLSLIDQFITCGSPIDKVHYFFESHKGKYHRYNRVVEDVRGDIGTRPFSSRGEPRIHWFNVWDRGDIISGSVETASPDNPKLFETAVHNYEVASFSLPIGGASHGAYFTNRHFVGAVYEAVFNNRHPSVDGPAFDPREEPPLEHLRPHGSGAPWALPLQVLTLALP